MNDKNLLRMVSEVFCAVTLSIFYLKITHILFDCPLIIQVICT